MTSNQKKVLIIFVPIVSCFLFLGITRDIFGNWLSRKELFPYLTFLVITILANLFFFKILLKKPNNSEKIALAIIFPIFICILINDFIDTGRARREAMYFTWSLGLLGIGIFEYKLFSNFNLLDWSYKRGEKEIKSFLSILVEIPGEDRGAIIVAATVMRLRLEEEGILPPNVFSESNGPTIEQANAAVELSKMAEQCQAINELQEAASIMVWVHSVRGMTMPKIRPLVREMWVELKKGFPYANEAILVYELISNQPLPQDLESHLFFIPSPFIETDL